MPPIANGFVCGANGNNIEIAEDLVRRTLQCGLDADMETPYLRTFKHNPTRAVHADRGCYVAAVLTIARAYVLAGKPGRPTPLASFEEWSDLVRGSLIWLGRADPAATITNLVVNDPVRERRDAVFAALAKTECAADFTVPKIIAQAKEDDALQAALLAAVRPKKDDPAAVSPDSLGWWLRRNAGRISGHYKLLRNENGRWSLAQTATF
jgi:putative DNA primase/helicase